jgi:hypothetical protein
MDFSVVAVMRNEESRAATWVAPLLPFLAAGGDVVVLDTGSTDGTVKILESQGVRVVSVGNIFRRSLSAKQGKNFNKWVGEDIIDVKDRRAFFEFGPAHNAASAEARHRHVLHLDAGDAPIVFDVEGLRAMLESDVLMDFRHEIGGPKEVQVATRLFDREKYQYAGRAHEYMVAIMPDVKPRKHIPPEILTVRYKRKDGHARPYLEPMYLDYLEKPWSRHYHYIGREMYYMEKWKAALTVFTKGWHAKFDQWDEERSQMCVYAGECCSHLKDWEQAWTWGFRAIRACARRRSPWLLCAQIARDTNQPQLCLSFVDGALAIPRPPPGLYEVGINYESRPHTLGLWASSVLDRKESMQKHAALGLDPMSALDTRGQTERTTPSDINEHVSLLAACASNFPRFTVLGNMNVGTFSVVAGLQSQMPPGSLRAIGWWMTLFTEARLLAPNVQIVHEDIPFEDAWATRIFEAKACDILFIDGFHCYAQVQAELKQHAHAVTTAILLHDTSIDALTSEAVRCNMDLEDLVNRTGYSKKDLTLGIWPAINEFIEESPDWVLLHRFTNNNGLTVLCRKDKVLDMTILLFPPPPTV